MKDLLVGLERVGLGEREHWRGRGEVVGRWEGG